MFCTFYGASAVDQDLSRWAVRARTDTTDMFSRAGSFNKSKHAESERDIFLLMEKKLGHIPTDGDSSLFHLIRLCHGFTAVAGAQWLANNNNHVCV